ncbi:Efflux pump [Lachnellula subtilissima]|uniref:Efflux pump n=1 Tax=Lachnellula subtilissima TaxID=602034 RepID=A0A8H8RJS8_9HELO|nr:Efflux pump [Lachnellula subtilissima]
MATKQTEDPIVHTPANEAGVLSRDDSRGIPDVQLDFKAVQRSFSFWAIIVGLGITMWLAALENSVITTAAPAILADIPLGGNWIWMTNAFWLSSAAFQPLLSQFANIFGRRWLTLFVIAIYTLGSGICGGSSSGRMLITGRAVQGMGSGGILLAFGAYFRLLVLEDVELTCYDYTDTIVSDMVPLRYRGNYIAIILLIYSIGSTMGALIGGLIVQHTSWRWVFYINLPVGGVSLLIMIIFLRVKHKKDTSWKNQLKRIDVVGNGILMGGSVSMLVALTYAGTRYSWSSWKTLVPLLIGFSAFVLFGIFEASRLAPLEPVMAPRLFANRTSVITAINTFLFNVILYWVIFFLPVYYQAVQLLSPTRAGINLIPISLLGVPSAAAAAVAVVRWGKYKIIHLLGFALFTIGLGLFTLLDETTPVGEWAGFDFVGPIGGGLLLNTQLLAFQAPVSEADQAAATGTWNFIRTLGGVWGVAIPAAIFSNRVDSLIAAGAISDPMACKLLAGGGAYQFASAALIKSFSPIVQAEVRAVYRLAIQRIFAICIAFSGFAWCLCLFEKDFPLRTELVTEYGLEVDENKLSKEEATS